MGDPGSIPGSGRASGEGSGNTLQCSCLENPTDRGAWWTIVHGAAKSQTQLSNTHTHTRRKESDTTEQHTHTHTHTHTHPLYVREITGTYCVTQETLLW